MANPIVVDLSHWNPEPDWAKLKAGGTIGCIHKVTEGTSIVDDTWFERVQAAMIAGLKCSTYHFLRPGSLPQQMDFYLAEQDKLMPLGSRVCLDYEDSGVSLGDLEYCVNYLRGKRPDLQITIYSGHVIKEQLGNNYSETLSTTSLWIAQYASAPEWPARTWPTWSLWQYTDKAWVDGISQPVDGDNFNGSVEQCLAWFGPAEEEPVPVPPEPPVGELHVIEIRTLGVFKVFVDGDEIELP